MERFKERLENYKNSGEFDIRHTDTRGSNLDKLMGYHHFDNNFIFQKEENEDDNSLFQGVEIEINNNDYSVDTSDFNDIVHNLRVLSRYQFICETDGSISHGFELISNPTTLNSWYGKYEDIKDTFNYLTDIGFVSDTANNGCCGLHIHLSKKYLGENETKQQETINFIWLILENFKENLCKLARRSSNHYSSYLSDYLTINNNKEYKTKSLDFLKNVNKNRSRYLALNTTNQHTIELRLFKGTLNIKTFYATLELAKNIVDLAKSCNGDLEQLIGKKFTDLVNINENRFLKDYCDLRNINYNSIIVDYSKQLAKLNIIKARELARNLLKNNNSIKNINSNLCDYGKKQEIFKKYYDLYSAIYSLGDYVNYLERFLNNETRNLIKNVYTNCFISFKDYSLYIQSDFIDAFEINKIVKEIKSSSLREIERHLLQEIFKYQLINDRYINDSTIAEIYKRIINGILFIKNYTI